MFICYSYLLSISLYLIVPIVFCNAVLYVILEYVLFCAHCFEFCPSNSRWCQRHDQKKIVKVVFSSRESNNCSTNQVKYEEMQS